MTPSTALHGFLAALGHPADTLPKETHELSGMYRTALAGRRMLIVLDNAQSAEQVRPLLANSPGSVTVVTSRDRLTGLTIRHGALRVDLDCLPKDASLHLLANVVGMDRINAEPEAVATLVSLCGSLPLALHIIGERLVRYPANPISEWVDTMIRNPNRLEGLDIPGDPATSLRAVFSWSYLALPAATARLFRLLGLNDRSEFKISQITRAFVEEKAIEPRLAMLVDSHLLTSPAPGKYRFHKLVHLYARERAEAEESSEYTAEFARRLRRSRRRAEYGGGAGTVAIDDRNPVVHGWRQTGTKHLRPDGPGERGGIRGGADLARVHGLACWNGQRSCRSSLPSGLLGQRAPTAGTRRHRDRSKTRKRRKARRTGCAGGSVRHCFHRAGLRSPVCPVPPARAACLGRPHTGAPTSSTSPGPHRPPRPR